MKPINRLALYALAFAVAFAAMLPTAQAGCGHLFHQKVVVQQVIQPVVVPYIYSTVSPYLASEAQTRAIVRDELRQQFRAQQLNSSETPNSSLVAQKCAACHNGAKAFDLSGGLTDFQKVRWMEMLGLDKDVPSEMKPLVAALKANGGADVTAEILRMPAARTEPEAGVLE